MVLHTIYVPNLQFNLFNYIIILFYLYKLGIAKYISMMESFQGSNLIIFLSML